MECFGLLIGRHVSVVCCRFYQTCFYVFWGNGKKRQQHKKPSREEHKLIGVCPKPPSKGKVSVAIFRHETPKRGHGNPAINGGQESGGVIAKTSKSERKRDKRRSPESGCSRVKKVSANVEMSRGVTVWEKTSVRNGEYFQVCLE